MAIPARPARCAVVDLGSNSVRLVVFEGAGRNPVTIFNEKAVLRLGRGLQATGLLNPEGVDQALTVMSRYHAIARAMGAEPLEVLATAAVRDASNGPAFVAALERRFPGMPIRILTGYEEARLSALGMLCGIPGAHGILADIGGGSLELVRLREGGSGETATLPLGVIRLADRAGGDPVRARAIVQADLAALGWLGPGEGGGGGEGRDLYLVGGAWRALARIHMAQTGYPLNMVHHYAVRREEVRDLTGMIVAAGRRALERLPAVSRRRIEDLPMAAVVLRRLLRATGVQRVVFSASGLREGWFMARLPDAVRAEDPLLAAGRDYARRFGRDPALPPALMAWTDPLFATDRGAARRLREAACWMSDIGSHDHPEYRAEQAFLRVLRQPGVGLDHFSRAFLAVTIALRYEAELDAPFLAPARSLLDVASAHRAEVLGLALRLAYTLSGGTAALLEGTAVSLEVGSLAVGSLAAGRLLLRLSEQSGLFAGESVLRRLDRLAQALGLDAATAVGSPAPA